MPPHWENVNTDVPYQVRAELTDCPVLEMEQDFSKTIQLYFSSLFLCTIRHMNIMKSLVSLGKQWIATELKEFREFKTLTCGSSFAGETVSNLKPLVGLLDFCSLRDDSEAQMFNYINFHCYCVFLLLCFDLVSQLSSSAFLGSKRDAL